MDETKKEIAHLQKQVRDLRKALLIMQVGMIVFYHLGTAVSSTDSEVSGDSSIV